MRHLCVILALVLGALISLPATAADKFDVLLREGTIIDGAGGPRYVADIGIRNGKIARIGDLGDAEAATTHSAKGLIVAPGFIDMMGQTATPMLDDPKAAMNLLTQGITTINAGEGDSAAPLDDDEAEHSCWQTMAEYFQILELKGLPVNVVQSVGHTQVREIVVGNFDKRPSERQMEEMKALVREAMEAGAIGLSTALIYPPAVYADREEIGQLAAVAGEYGGRYYTHLRNEGDRLLEAIDEALEIGKAGKVPVHIFHLKAAGRDNWPKMAQAIGKIQAARASGYQVSADIYPYIHNGLGISSLVHPRHFADGRTAFLRRLRDPALRTRIRGEMENEAGWENWFRHVGCDWDKIIVGRSSDGRYAQHAGKSLAEIARSLNEDPWNTFFALVRAGTFVMPETMSEENKKLAMQQPFISFCTDAGPVSAARPASHPRSCGSFPRLIARYVREQGVISLEQAVAHASGAAADAVMAGDRGRIAEGLAADLIVFDYDTVNDRATFARPNLLSEGMRHVLVNGQFVLEDGRFTEARPGRVLRGPGFDRQRARTAVSTGETDPRMVSFDRMMSAFLERHQVPGAALAVTDQGRLVYARGFGYADVADKQKVEPTSLFRIASLSKPITAVAALQLAEQGRLNLDDKVFDLLDWSKLAGGEDSYDERLESITAGHLLHHRGGWDRSQSFDPMFQSVRFAEAQDEPPPAEAEVVIRAMFGQPLDFAPGERYAYSNYGYCLLGRIIEKISGEPYEDYVKKYVLSPLGVQSMAVGHTRLEDRLEHEVRYYDPRTGRSVFARDRNKPVPQPYGAWYLEAMDAHGGWVASAVDLARFAAAFDRPEACKILSAESIALMYARPPETLDGDSAGDAPPVYYSCGWHNRVVAEGRMNHWHTGSLPGTSTLLVRRHDGRNWVILFNARVSPHTSQLSSEADRLLHRAADQVTEWPEYDLFEEY